MAISQQPTVSNLVLRHLHGQSNSDVLFRELKKDSQQELFWILHTPPRRRLLLLHRLHLPYLTAPPSACYHHPPTPTPFASSHLHFLRENRPKQQHSTAIPESLRR